MKDKAMPLGLKDEVGSLDTNDFPTLAMERVKKYSSIRKIETYSPECFLNFGDPYADMKKDIHGEWMKKEDHLAEIKILRKEWQIEHEEGVDQIMMESGESE